MPLTSHSADLASITVADGGTSITVGDGGANIADGGIDIAVADGGPVPLPADHPATLVGMLERAARCHPGHGVVYLDDAGRAQTQLYPDLLADAARILGGLRAMNLAPGDPVLFQLPANADFIPAFWACTLGGFVPVPVTIAPTYEQPHSILAKLANAWRLLGGPVTLTDATLAPRLQTFAATEGLTNFRTAPIETLRTHAPATEWHPSQPEDLALLLLTSGSTGMPKAVRQTHANLVTWAASVAHACAFTAADTSLNWMPLDHVGGLVMFHIRDVSTGCMQLHAPTEAVLRRPLTWLDWIDTHRATITWAPNFAYGLVNEYATEIAAGQWDLSRMRFVLNGGEAIVSRTARRFLELLAPFGLPPTAMRPAWGMSETCSGITYSHHFTRADTADTDPFVSVGGPIPGLRLRIVDAQDRAVAPGRVGQLQVTGISVTPGYHQNPAATADMFSADGWFVTGDLGVIGPDGLTIVGREKDVIIINAANFYSHEIEAIVEDIEGVAVSFTAACAVRPSSDEPERLAIFFSHAPSATIPLPELIRSIRRVVTQRAGITPDVILPLPPEDIPKTAIGKIQRSQLKDRFERGDFSEILAGLTATPLPGLFRRVWREAPIAPMRLPENSRVLVFAPSGDQGVGGIPGDQAVGGARDGRVIGGARGSRTLSGVLRANGHGVITVAPGRGFIAHAPDSFTIDPASPADYRRLLDALARTPITHVVHAWSYSESPVIDNAASIEAAQRLGSLSLLHLLGAWPAATPTRLLIVSSGIHADDAVDFAKAPLLGLLRTIPEEYDALRCSHLDFDIFGSTTDVAAIMAELGDSGTTEARICDGVRVTPLLVQAETPDAGATPDNDGFIVLTGGAGGIGRVLTAHFATRQARMLLLGRTARPDMVAALERAGADVRHAAGDITDPAFVRGAVAAAADHWGRPPGTVLHLAGAYHETPLAQETEGGLLDLLRPKLAGAWALHALAADYPACRFVHFSSLIGQFGALGTGAYGAANAGLDAFARYQRAAGVNSTSIAWSLWVDTGMGQGISQHGLRARGYVPLPPIQAIGLLERAMRGDADLLLAGIDVDNRSMRRHLDAGTSTATSGASHIPVAPRNATEIFIAGLWQDLLGIPSVGVHDNFFDIGGRSLLAARMFARIDKERGRKLPLATLYQAPTIAELATILDTAGPVEGMEIHAIQPHGALPPFFCIPGVGSDVITLQSLAEALGRGRPFYGLQAHGLDGTPSGRPISSVEDVAAGFVSAIRAVQPDGPYHIGGHCFGSLLAWEVACQLSAQRQAVALLALIDPVVSNVFPADIIQRDRLHYSLLKFLRLPVAQKGRYLLQKLRNVRRFMLVRERLGQSIEQARAMYQGYRIDTYHGEITVFMATESFLNVAPERDPRRYFERFASATRYIPAAGDHDSMLQPPAVEDLAGSLGACLTVAADR